MTDHYTTQRKRWIESVSPFHIHESRTRYHLAWLLNLIFGMPMPHEKERHLCD